MWEVKEGDDNSTSGDSLHDSDDRYSWYNTTSSGLYEGYDGNFSNTCFGYDSNVNSAFCDTQAYVKRVNAAGWCGYTDWRLPTLAELISIVDYSASRPTIDMNYFPFTKSDAYWSSSLAAEIDGEAWTVQFSNGIVYFDFTSKANALRLVRSK